MRASRGSRYANPERSLQAIAVLGVVVADLVVAVAVLATDRARVPNREPKPPVLLHGRVRSGVDPAAAAACRNFGMQSRSHSGHGFGGSEDGLGGPSMSITTAARSAIHGPNMKCTLR